MPWDIQENNYPPKCNRFLFLHFFQFDFGCTTYAIFGHKTSMARIWTVSGSSHLLMGSLNPILFSPCSVQTSLTPNCLKITIPGFLYNCLPVSCGDIGFIKKILGLVLDCKSGLKVLLLPLGDSCSLQTILLSDLVGCNSPLRIVNVVHFFQLLISPNWHYYISSWLSSPTQQVQIFKKVCQTAITICRGLSRPFSRAENPLRI